MLKPINRAIVLVGLTLLALSDCSAATSDKISLKFRLKEGAAYTQKTSSTQEIVHYLSGMRHQTTTTMDFAVRLNVEKVKADGTMQATLTYTSAALKQEGPTGTLEYDSSDPPEHLPPGVRAIALLVGRPLGVTMAPDGEILALRGLDEVYDRIIEDSELPEAMKDQFLEDMKKLMGEDALAQMMKLAPFPEEPVAVGDKWTDESTAETGFPFSVETTWTLKSRENGTAIIYGESTVEPDDEAELVKLGPTTMRFDFSGTQQTTIELDEETGWTQKGSLRQELQGTVSIKLPDMEDEVSAPMKMRTIVTTEGGEAE